MDSNITINIVGPGGPTPVDPVVPNTGLFTHGIGGPEATILGISAAVVILAVVLAVLYYRNKKQGKFMSLKHKKATTIGLASLAAVVSLGTVAGLLKLGANAAEAEEVAEVTDGELTIELGDEPVFAYVKSTVTVTEDMPAGYTLKAYSANPTLSTEGTDKTISMVTIPEDELDHAGTLATALTDNTWGLAVEEPESQADEIYFSLPATAEEAITIATVEDMEAEGSDTTTVYYGVYITPGLPYGTYTGANVSYEVEPHYITNLSFDGNDADGGTAMEGMTLVAGDTITLPQNTFTKEGYSFTGWNTQADGEGKAYADEAEFTASLTESEDITLYAQWKLPPTIDNLTYMQDFATFSSDDKTSVLNSMAQGQQYTLKDSRDQKTYYISKLADGNVWMTQNLDLDIEAGRTYTSADTDLANSTIGTSWTPTVSTSTTSSWTISTTAPQSYDPGDLYWNGTVSVTSGNLSNRTVSDPSVTSGGTHYHVGNYYNWTAAVAMNDSSSYTTNQTDVNQSICPAGWRLPTYSGDKSYQNLVSAQGLTSGTSGNIQSTPTYFVYSGSGSTNVGTVGDCYSSTVADSDIAYYLDFSAYGTLNSQAYYSPRYLASSLRCVAR